MGTFSFNTKKTTRRGVQKNIKSLRDTSLGEGGLIFGMGRHFKLKRASRLV